jgi:hypothetical protein
MPGRRPAVRSFTLRKHRTKRVRPHSVRGMPMGTSGRKNEPPKRADKKPQKSLSPLDEEDCEDGDIATPKRDRYGPDDEPL